ncbi:MAG: SDR family NAD(P)-dependent oxidoreductase [Gammaproteobacteria bacterium]|nr:SDR family NAD(P)-dependent oxidoreductase [Gammaproteobacteria bacterium]MBL6998307.1 SDR family NAD(P)-dependent oxidoreductase [Gammaproteobacteria bacterium]
MKTISILGTGWLGLPLAKHLVGMGYQLKASTTSESRLAQLAAHQLKPYVVDIGNLNDDVSDFLQSQILIVNIPSKDIDGFTRLIQQIETSRVEKVLFVSSTSVYADNNQTITESDHTESTEHPLFQIENLFRNCKKITTSVVRFGGLIGYSRNPAKFFRPGRSVQNPDANVNLIHRDDCIGIIAQLIQQDIWGEVFNACADTHPTKTEFYTQAALSSDFPVPVFDHSLTRSFKIISNHKLKKILHYEFTHPDLMNIRFIENT